MSERGRRRRPWGRLFMVALLLGGAGIGQAGGGSAEPSSGPAAEPAAKLPASAPAVLGAVNGVPITEADLPVAVRLEVRELERQTHDLRRAGLEEVIAQRLLLEEARRLDVTVEQLLGERVEKHIPPVPEETLRTVYERHKAEFPPVPFDDLKEALAMRLSDGKRQELVRELITALKRQAKVEVYLTPLRLEVTAEGPAMGEPTAPVTIVEFSHFLCRECGQMHPVLRRLLRELDGQVRLVHRDYALPLHPEARPAAIAARCAQREGKYWPYHDRLYEQRQDQLERADLVALARDLGIDPDPFARCLDGPEVAAEVDRDLAAGTRLGVSVTPTYFINGRPVLGAHSFGLLRVVVEDELALAARRPDARPPADLLPPVLAPPPPGVAPGAAPPAEPPPSAPPSPTRQ